MNRRLIFIAAFAFSVLSAAAQEHPRLVVVISLDQVRHDYLERFRPSFGKGGFERLRTSGAAFANASLRHARTTTGPGHAVMLTGTYGDQNGIVTNHWYDPVLKKRIYCVQDDSVRLVGAKGSGVSPRNLMTTTLGDELKIQSGFRARVVSLSHKDRAAILMGGKLADLALWLRDSTFVTSTYYRSTLPSWVEKFNRSGRVTRHFGAWWKLSPGAARFAGIFPDDVPWENGGNGLGRAFPHRVTGDDTSRISKSYYTALLTSPFGNEVLETLAKEAISADSLGQRGFTDMLCVSFSGTDYAGHAYGPYSLEVADMLVRMDGLLADLFGFLDARIGKGRYLAVLTADHGASPAPEYLQRYRPTIEAGRVSPRFVQAAIESTMVQAFGVPAGSKDWHATLEGESIYLDKGLLKNHGLDPVMVARELARALPAIRGVGPAAATEDLYRSGGTTVLEQKLRRSCYPGRVGDVVFSARPYFVGDEGDVGSSHGEPYEYDSHVPLMIMGPGVLPGRYLEEVSPADIAPTLAALMGVEFPAARTGRALVEALVMERGKNRK